MEWALLPLKRYAEFTGRSRRKEYWMFVLLAIGLNIIAAVLDSLLGSRMGNLGIVAMLLALVLLVPSIAVGVRRLHDTDKSGWWLLIALIPFIGAIVLIVFYATDGTKGPNRFGEDPKAENLATVF